MASEIIFKGLRDLNKKETDTIRRLSEREFPKIKREFSNARLTVDVKKASKTGNRSRYTVILRVAAPTKVILQGEHIDWELERAVHRCFANLQSAAMHKFKVGVVKRIKKLFE